MGIYPTGVTVSKSARRLSASSVALGVLVTASCASSPEESSPNGCTRTITHSDEVAAAMDTASPGDTLCFTGGDLTDADVTVRRSGTSAAPIKLVSHGATVYNMHVTADHIVIEDFLITGGEGLRLEGTGITAQRNTIRDTQRSGIACVPCTDSTIASNTVQHASTSGVYLTGQGITVRDNTVSETVARDDGDADGMRFFGTGHRIIGNTIRDISARGYSAPPHPDCFQTFDHKPSTFDVVIADNTCRNVDAQCLIATDDQPGSSAAPAGIPSIIFIGNTCETTGAQAINLRRWPQVEVRQNRFSGPGLQRAVLIIDGSTGCAVIGNTTAGGVPTVDVDGPSRAGFQQDGNSPT